MESRGWHYFGPFVLFFSLWSLAYRFQSWEFWVLVIWAFPTSWIWFWQISAGIVLRRADWYGIRPRTEAKTDEPKAEVDSAPSPDGFRPIVRVNNKPHFAFVTKTQKLNREREMYVILWRWYETGREINLTEAYWVKQKKFFTRKAFAGDVMKRADRNSITCRVSANTNAARDIMDWRAVEKIARGGDLPH